MRRKTEQLKTVAASGLGLAGVLMLLAVPAIPDARERPRGEHRERGRQIESRALKERMAKGGRGRDFVDVIIQYDRVPNDREISRVKGRDGRINHRFGRLKMLAAQVPLGAVSDLAAGRGVKRISLDLPVEGFSASARATARVPEPGSPSHVHPASDIAIAVLDSGVADHWDVSLQKRVDIIAAYQGGVNVRDEFNAKSFSNNDGAASWSDDWQEVGETNGPGSGDIKVDKDEAYCPLTKCLIVRAEHSSELGATRVADLSGAVSASLSFTYGHNDREGGVDLRVSSDGGMMWETLHSFDFSVERTNQTLTADLTPYLSEQTQIGFFVTYLDDARMAIDDLEILMDGGVANDDDDPFGHGTHVAGIVGGDGNSSGGLNPGIAPGAPVVSVRVLDESGRGLASDVIAGLDWVLQNAAVENIRVVNLSLGKAIEESAATDPLVAATEALWDVGIVVVCSAGNYGRDGNFTITSPGNSPKVITVGSITDSGTGSTFTDDYVSTYSSMGPTLIDHHLKPDLLAPGNRFIAPMKNGKLMKLLPDRKQGCGSNNCPGGEYLELSGTSMAAPQVAATAALMLTQDPSLNPASIKARLMRSARKIEGDPVAVGTGVLDVEAALAETGWLAAAPSPTMNISQEGPVVVVEDTALTWYGEEWASGYLWADGYLWSNGYTVAEGYLWADAYLWSNGYLWSNSYLWSNGYLWSNSYMWANGYLWSNAVEDVDPLFAQTNLNDD